MNIHRQSVQSQPPRCVCVHEKRLAREIDRNGGENDGLKVVIMSDGKLLLVSALGPRRVLFG